jgi:(5-formylfuran-3-yl)methyl phosphate transaminase
MKPAGPIRLSRAAQAMPPFLAMEVLEAAQARERAGESIIHLELGEPDFPTPEVVREAAVRALADGETHYTHSLGIWPLREAIAEWYASRCRVEVSPERVIVTSGSSAGLCLLMAALIDPGDEVVLADPRYACYPNFVTAFGGRPVSFPLDAADGFRYHAEAARAAIAGRTRALLVNSPGNPTGAIQPRAALEALAGLGVPLIADEIYHGLEYGERAVSILEITDRAFVLDGFSKRFAMTGWRLGWLVVPPECVRAIQKVQQNLFICANAFVQRAGIAALREAGPDAERMRQVYAGRRAFMLARLRELGFPIAGEPAGAYYLLADSRHLDADSVRLSRRLLDEARIGVTPGVDFGPRAEGFLRFSYANHLDQLREGLDRLERWLQAPAG